MPNREDQIFTEAVPLLPCMNGYLPSAKGSGADKYMLDEKDLLWLVRQAKKLQVVGKYLDESGSQTCKNDDRVLDFIHLDEPLPLRSPNA